MTKASYQRALYLRRKIAGLCVDCGKNPPRLNHMRCEPCLAKRRAARDAKIARGLCPRCSQPTREDRKLCPDCLTKARERRSKLVKNRRQAGMCIFCGKNPVQPPYTICLPCRIKKRAREGDYRLDGGSREEVLIRDGGRCRLCGDTKDTRPRNIMVHHVDGSGQTKERNHNLDNLIILCKACHRHVHLIAKFCTDLDLFIKLVKGLR